MRAIACQAGQNKITQQDLPISLLSDMVGKIVQVGWLVRREKNYECRGSVDDESSTKSHARTHTQKWKRGPLDWTGSWKEGLRRQGFSGGGAQDGWTTFEGGLLLFNCMIYRDFSL